MVAGKRKYVGYIRLPTRLMMEENGRRVRESKWTERDEYRTECKRSAGKTSLPDSFGGGLTFF